MNVTEKALYLLKAKFRYMNVRRGLNKTKMSEELGITRPTLYTRLSGKTRWRSLEKRWINKMYDYCVRAEESQV